jgi:queuine tRNA-ribosyltransferase
MSFALHATDGRARRGTLSLAHGYVETPAFMPVGTAATVKALSPDELRGIDANIILANTYHLWLRPGRETIEALGGLHAFMSWDRNILTDSGGFQVFSLESRRVLSEEGVRFKSHLDGSPHEFTPENVVGFQEALGVDIAMALDVCVKLPATQAEIDEGVRLTTAWAKRCAAARTREATALFGIVQGGLDEASRARSASELVALDFPGYAIGGLSVGESRDDLYRMTRFSAALLPERKPRYLMGVGTTCSIACTRRAAAATGAHSRARAISTSAPPHSRAIQGRSTSAAGVWSARPTRARICRISSVQTRCSDRGCSRSTISQRSWI